MCMTTWQISESVAYFLEVLDEARKPIAQEPACIMKNM